MLQAYNLYRSIPGAPAVYNRNLLLEMLRRGGPKVPIISGFDCNVYAGTAIEFVNCTKLTWLLFAITNVFGNRIPDEVTQQNGSISSGTLALTFDSVDLNILAYIITFGFPDNVGLGSLTIDHDWDDQNGDTQNFEFSVNPNKRECSVLYIANAGVGAKYVPNVNQSSLLVPTATTPTVAVADNDFTIAGPNSVQCTVLPISQTSPEVADLVRALPFMLQSSMPKAGQRFDDEGYDEYGYAA